MWDRIGNPEDRFSHNEAHICLVVRKPVFGIFDQALRFFSAEHEIETAHKY